MKPKQIVTAEAPTRIDLAGGTLDLWPLHFLVPKAATVNFAINLNAKTQITLSPDHRYHITSQDQHATLAGSWDEVTTSPKLPLITYLLHGLWDKHLPPISITTSAMSPAGAGLGGSSCLGITIARALLKARYLHDGKLENLDEHRLVRTVQDAEARIIRIPTGCQDYWGAVRGGINGIEFEYGRTKVTTKSNKQLPQLASELIVCFSGKSRASSKNNWEIFKKAVEGDKHVIQSFTEIGELAIDCMKEIFAGNLNEALKISEEEWKIRTTLWADIETQETRAIASAAKSAGAMFTRVCGAGGGGVMAIFAPAAAHTKVKEAVTKVGGQVLVAQPTDVGITVTE
jgi:D-glycero-alpha-D-manno-heptose-7-phosphate kinase